ncbi:MAG: hypothetical protein AAGI03_01825 [Pseudomonadota bacterium]
MSDAKDRWDKAETVAKLVGVTLVPLVVAATAYFINGQISLRQSNTEIVKLAIGILSEPAVIDENSPEDPLRRWALDNLGSEFQFSEPERALLLTGERTLPDTIGRTPVRSNLLGSLPSYNASVQDKDLYLQSSDSSFIIPKLIFANPVFATKDGRILQGIPVKLIFRTVFGPTGQPILVVNDFLNSICDFSLNFQQCLDGEMVDVTMTLDFGDVKSTILVRQF